MKKLTLLFAVAFAVVGSAMAQMAIPGEVFAGNPARFNGRKVTIKNIEIVKSDANHGGPAIGGPAGALHGAPGAVGTPSAPSTHPCRPPRGFAQVNLFFKGMPEYKGCFFMAENMKTQMDREVGHENAPAQVTFRGDSRTGYMISFYRLGM
jgi:hypothetical protein